MNAQTPLFRLTALVVLLVLLSPSTVLAKGKKKKTARQADSGTLLALEPQTLEHRGNQRTYYLYVPEGITAENPAPLLVLFHGAGRSGTVLIEEWEDLADREKVILVGPEAHDRRFWQIPVDGPGFIHAVTEAVRRELPVDPHRIFLFGHSSGAIFALQMAMLESRYFAASAASAGSFQPPGGDPWIGYVQRKIPIFLVIGTEDRVFPVEGVRKTGEALREAGLPVELWEIEEHDHNYYGRANEINERTWGFLSQHRLAGEPVYKRFY